MNTLPAMAPRVVKSGALAPGASAAKRRRRREESGSGEKGGGGESRDEAHGRYSGWFAKTYAARDAIRPLPARLAPDRQ